MARKSRKGYYVDGEFVAEGSYADQQFRNEMKGGETPSRTELKEASEKLQELGEELLTLRRDLFDGLPLPEKLRDAILEAKRLTSLEALRRQKQFIGKLMHRLDAEALDAVSSALLVQSSQSAQDIQRLHQAEKWRDALIADDGQLGVWVAQHPETEVQPLRALIRQARKDAVAGGADGKARQGRAYREIFRQLRAALAAPGSPGESAGTSASGDSGNQAD